MGFDSFGISGIMFSVIPVIVVLGFILVFGLIIFRVVQSAKTWKKNNDSPVLTVSAKVVTKRSDVNYHHQSNMTNHNMPNNTMDMGYSSTDYYVTFEVPSGDRMEFYVPDTEYGMVTEGDHGSLTFQGTRFLSFERDTRI